MAENVYEYFAETFNRNPSHDSGLRDYAITSHCGQICKSIIDDAKALMDKCDNHRHVVEPLLQAITAAIEIRLLRVEGGA